MIVLQIPLLNRYLQSGQISFEKSLPSSGYISNASKNHGSNHHAQKEESCKTMMVRLWMTIEPSIFMRKSYQPSCTSLPYEHHCHYEFYLKMTWSLNNNVLMNNSIYLHQNDYCLTTAIKLNTLQSSWPRRVVGTWNYDSEWRTKRARIMWVRFVNFLELHWAK